MSNTSRARVHRENKYTYRSCMTCTARQPLAFHTSVLVPFTNIVTPKLQHLSGSRRVSCHEGGWVHEPPRGTDDGPDRHLIRPLEDISVRFSRINDKLLESFVARIDIHGSVPTPRPATQRPTQVQSRYCTPIDVACRQSLHEAAGRVESLTRAQLTNSEWACGVVAS